ncbi:UDP-N-acetylmuramoyl-L-alanyl-D-glutamate--2,6-diaminopimelate ligase [Anaerosalibacter massiliensis]|uniref:UDP-N-acetylmuramoyl-L-alanyl-D-glutamate--2, 6-diaminopimelate ligase n=1 Tax=Anaerosalibacter massiliensis TaxID=1347392 RepID=UPI0005B2694F|nr:UDP-N-acetylmuramoyl-L-alanyl-D-glutamate--2,6-diaminopimelate ligase [Anaerosalibacter massiliensis]
MKIKNLIEGLEIEKIHGDLEKDIKGIGYDSRKIDLDYLFVAIEGFESDGHKYIQEAIKRGAIALVVEKDIKLDREDITIIRVEDGRDSLARISSNFYGKPSQNMKVIGVTGTNGKTSITYLVKSILDRVNKNTGVIGTMGSVIDGEVLSTENTTPESLWIQRYLYTMLKEGTKHCVMEVSSHSLDLKRVEYCNFDIGVFTNLSRDHLDYHNTVENYFNAKLKLFYMTNKCNIINIDDKYGRRIIEETKNLDISTITYGIEKKSTIYATDIEYHLKGVDFKLNTPKGSIDISFNIPGEFSVYNALAAASVAYCYGIDLKGIKEGLEAVEGIRGRFEIVPTNEDFSVIIDFAHTPDGLEKVLSTIKEFAEGRIVAVFGAGGNRDRTKRPIMGESVGKYADFLIVTSDNPRNEEPMRIIDDVVEGVKKVNNNYIKVVDRKEAIEYAIKNAKPKDIILLAGKGHETYTIIGNEVLPFDERQIVLDFLKEIKN